MTEERHDTELGLLPNDWEIRKFSEVFSFIKTYSFSRNKLSDIITKEGVQYIHYGDIHTKFRSNILDVGRKQIPYLIDDFVDKKFSFLIEGDLVIADASEDYEGVAACVELMNVNDSKIIGGLHTLVARDKYGLTTNGFRGYIFKNEFVSSELRMIATGLSVYGISKGNLSRLKIPIPTWSEQRKIAHILSTVQKAIGQQDKLIKITTELKKALMQKLFTEGLYGELQKETEIGRVPESWEVVKISELGKCVTGTTPKTKVPEYWDSSDFDFIAPADIGITKYVYKTEKYVSKLGYEVSRQLPKNSVLCVCIGSSIGKVGLTYQDQSCTNQQINSIICNEAYNPIFIYYMMSQFKEHWKSHSTFGPVPILNKGQFEQIQIHVTKSIKEQEGIADVLSTFDRKIEFHRSKKVTLTDLFKTLLHELMTGARRVHEIEFEGITKEPVRPADEYKIEDGPISMAAEP